MRSISRFAAVAALVAVAACSSTSSHPAAPAPRSPSSAPTSAPATKVDPLALVGSWNVVTPQGKPTSDYLEVDDGLTLTSSCGELLGSWSANTRGMFVAEFDGGTGSCVHVVGRRVQVPSWVTAASGFAIAGNSATLLDDSGHVVAQLFHGHGIHERPSVSALPTAPLLPSSLTPPSAQTIEGRWLPAPVRHYSDLAPNVTFASDGSWSGSDGCNGQGGRWRLGTGGDLVTTTGPSTQIGCAGVPVGGWMARARQAGLAGKTLVLLDGTGHEIGRLVRR